jgi:hypothetical protein
MSSGDNYEYEKANIPQDIDAYSPYVEKQQSSFVNDLNNSVYANSSLSLVQFDLGQIFNSSSVTDPGEMYLVVPLCIVAACRTNTGVVTTASPGGSQLCSLKSNFIHLISQADIQIGGKTLESSQPHLNIVKHFKMISELSVNDLATIGPTLGFSDRLDTTRSMRYVSAITATDGNSGNGLTNNRPFGAGEHQGVIVASQNDNACNTAIQGKLNRYVDTSANINNSLALVTVTQLNNEFKPYYEFKSGYHCWYDYGVIRISDIFESMGNLGLVQRLDCNLRLWLNTGTVNVSVGGTLNTLTQSYLLPQAQSTFTNTCPLMINYLPSAATPTTGFVATIPATTTGIVAGLFIAKPPTTSISGVNLGASNASHPLQNCRIYYSQITLKPEKHIEYINNNRAKKVVYRSFITNVASNIAVNGTWSSIVSAGVTHPTSVLLVPLIASNTTTGLMDFQYKSPFDTCPSTTSCLSISNLQCSVGGKNQLQSSLTYNYDNFISQVNNAEQLVSAQDYGLSNGLFSQQWWENSKYYYINCERSQSGDKLAPRNITLSFTNNSNVNMDVLIFVQYAQDVTIDVATGLVITN